MPDEPVIEYGVKELLGELRKEVAAGFSEVKTALNSKADKSDLAEIRGELRGHAERLVSLERDRDERRAADQAHAKVVTARTEWKRWAIPTGLTAAYTLVVLIQAHVF